MFGGRFSIPPSPEYYAATRWQYQSIILRPLPGISEPIFLYLVLFLFAKVLACHFLIPLCFLFLLLFKCQKNQLVEEVMRCSTRLLQGVLWLKNLTNFLGCEGWISGRRERDTCTESCSWADEDTVWLCVAKPWTQGWYFCTWESLGCWQRQPGVCRWGQALTWDSLNIGVGFLVAVTCSFSGNEVSFYRNKTIELQNCTHRGVKIDLEFIEWAYLRDV